MVSRRDGDGTPLFGFLDEALARWHTLPGILKGLPRVESPDTRAVVVPIGEVTAIVGRPKFGMKSWLGAERQRADLVKSGISNVLVGPGVFCSAQGETRAVGLADGCVSQVLAKWAKVARPVLVVLDPLGMYLPEFANTNDYRAMLGAVEELLNLARDIGGAVVYTHHTTTGRHDRQLGSQALEGVVAQMLFMRRDDGDPKATATVCSWFFSRRENALQFRVVPRPGGGGHVQHLGSAAGEGASPEYLEQRREWRMVTLLKTHISQCHDITRLVLADTFPHVAGVVGDYMPDGRSALGLGNPKSGSLQQFMRFATARGWLEETGRVDRTTPAIDGAANRVTSHDPIP